MMPLLTTLVKLTLFVAWAVPTYRSTIDMLELRERRLKILPPETKLEADDAARPTDGETTGRGAEQKGKTRPK